MLKANISTNIKMPYRGIDAVCQLSNPDKERNSPKSPVSPKSFGYCHLTVPKK